MKKLILTLATIGFVGCLPTKPVQHEELDYYEDRRNFCAEQYPNTEYSEYCAPQYEDIEAGRTKK